jgi:hypothetical protein
VATTISYRIIGNDFHSPPSAENAQTDNAFWDLPKEEHAIPEKRNPLAGHSDEESAFNSCAMR